MLTKIAMDIKFARLHCLEKHQYVAVDDTHSELLKVTYGIPQGSILCPLLVLIFIHVSKS